MMEKLKNPGLIKPAPEGKGYLAAIIFIALIVICMAAIAYFGIHSLQYETGSIPAETQPGFGVSLTAAQP